MTKNIPAILWILLMLGGLYLAFRIMGWRMKRAADFIISDLEKKNAFDPSSAVELPYAKSRLLRPGLRDFRPAALQELIKQDVVRILEGKRYYLRKS
jgi:hypothetical protein